MLAHHKSQKKKSNKNGTDKCPDQLVLGCENKIQTESQQCHYYWIINKMMRRIVSNVIFKGLFFHA